MKEEKLMGVGIFTAIAAALCCITPVFAMLAGIGGIAATFSWIEPFRPYLIGLTVFVLGFAWYQKLKPQGDIDCVCDDDKPSFWQGKPFLGLITVFAVTMMAFPYYSGVFYGTNVNASSNPVPANSELPQNSGKYENMVFAVDGMTCDSCERHVESTVSKVDGVVKTKATFKDGKAVVTFEKGKVTRRQIEDAINSTGYKVKKVDDEASDEADKYANVVFVVDGMTCAGCESGVEKAARIDGVSKVKASYKKGTAVVTFDKEKTNAEDIRKAIAKTGYSVKQSQ